MDDTLVPLPSRKRSEIQIDGIWFDVLKEDAPQPWDFYEAWDEKPYYYQLFVLYRDLPPIFRSIRRLRETYRDLQERSGAVYQSPVPQLEDRKWGDLKESAFWDERALAWDESRRLKAESLRVALDEERFKEVTERDWRDAAELRDKIEKAIPLLSAFAYGEDIDSGETRTAEDGTVERIIIRPAKMKLGILDVARVLQAVSDLQRQALSGQVIPPPAGVDVKVTAEAQVQSWEGRVYEVRLNEANDQLERLRAENEQLREQLTHLQLAMKGRV